jgi:pyrroline-5-carboxylate reductase
LETICGDLVLNKNQEVRKMGIQDRRIAFIGGGHITEIIVSNLVKTQGVLPSRLIVSDPLKGKVEKLQSKYGITMAQDNLEAIVQR